MGLETLFYLPNRFRQSLFYNTMSINFETSENFLLGLMRRMFNLGERAYSPNQGPQTKVEIFSFGRFAQIYHNFFRSTMLFEGCFYSFNYFAYSSLTEPISPKPTDWAIAFMSGIITQGILCARFFNLNLLNHRHGAQQLNRAEFKAEAKSLPWIETNPVVLARGGLLSIFLFPMFQRIAQLLDSYKFEIGQSKSPLEAYLQKE